MPSEAEELCAQILRIFDNTTRKYDENYEAIGKLEKEQQDILHEIELAELQDQERGYSLYVELREIRRNRRKLRDENGLLKPLAELFRENERFRQRVYKTCATIRELERLQEERKYMPRVRDDLTICQSARTRSMTRTMEGR